MGFGDEARDGGRGARCRRGRGRRPRPAGWPARLDGSPSARACLGPAVRLGPADCEARPAADLLERRLRGACGDGRGGGRDAVRGVPRRGRPRTAWHGR